MPFELIGGDLEYKPMDPEKFRAVRLATGLGRLRFGFLLGMTGAEQNIATTIRRYETGLRDISPTVERLALMLLWFKEDFGYLPDLDRGERVPLQTPAEFTA